MELQGNWIKIQANIGDVCPVFRKRWSGEPGIVKAELLLTALGVYEARINGRPVSDYVLAPGWTAYQKRLQYQKYDITDLLETENELRIILGKGWFSSPMPGWFDDEDKKRRTGQPNGLLGEIRLLFDDGREAVMPTGGDWEYGESRVRFSEIYDGESYDARVQTDHWQLSQVFDWSKDILIPQEGEIIKEQERIAAKAMITTPTGETVIDFGQEITGYVEFTLTAAEGEKLHILHGEVLDEKGNFYRDNYRSAKAEIRYVCREGQQTWHPKLTFFGFRYLKLAAFPGTPSLPQFTAIAVYSEIARTGRIRCSEEGLNRLFDNIFWGQRGNFLDVPTDCPQRDERLGWTGDAAAFVKAASFNFNVERFFKKWLHDLGADQRENGAVGQVVPDYIPEGAPSAAWGDAAVICPWEIYLTYGDVEILKDQFSSMKKWVDYITSVTTMPGLWTGGEHFGDWLGLDAPVGSYKGSSREDFIATAFYAYSAGIVVKAGKVLQEAVADYEELHNRIVAAFRRTFSDYRTQTEYTIAIWFGLAPEPEKAAGELAGLVERDGCKLQTGFVGTPFLMHALSRYGYTELAYRLLLRREYPSWLYAVDKGATTIWEHWDGIMEDGGFWSADMNSFNHYAYGAVADWVYEVAAGIQRVEAYPGFARVRVEPRASRQLKWLEASIETKQGLISSRWSWIGEEVKYEISSPVPATIVIEGKTAEVGEGNYIYWGNGQF